MQSVLLNIVMNALDATDSGGSILITTNIGYSTSKRTRRRDSKISVHRHGGTASPPKTWRGFSTPFFTTKEVGKGTGLGLSGSPTDRGAARGLNSRAERRGKGSTFTIWLSLEDKGEELEKYSWSTDDPSCSRAAAGSWRRRGTRSRRCRTRGKPSKPRAQLRRPHDHGHQRCPSRTVSTSSGRYGRTGPSTAGRSCRCSS